MTMQAPALGIVFEIVFKLLRHLDESARYESRAVGTRDPGMTWSEVIVS
jgi:hypothetical protein